MQKTTVATVVLEEASLHAEVRDNIQEAATLGETLHYTGQNIIDAIAQVPSDAPASTLRASATKLLGAALHALQLSAHLAERAGRLTQLASLREASDVLSE